MDCRLTKGGNQTSSTTIQYCREISKSRKHASCPPHRVCRDNITNNKLSSIVLSPPARPSGNDYTMKLTAINTYHTKLHIT